ATALPTQTSTPIPPTETPIPSPIPANTGNVLLQDDFSTENWGTLSSTDSSVQYDGAALRMKMFKKNWFVWTTPNGEVYQDVHMEVTATNNDGEATTAFGLICYQQTTTSNYYYLAMTPAGEYAIVLAADGASDLFLTNNNKWGASDLIKKKQASYRVGADCGNGTLTLYVDGQLIASVSDSTYTDGSAGVFTWSGENVSNADVTFDDFILSSLK
ncbi:MAG: hypothetical protein ABI904_08980, partial [Chloroflexota bacterium]